MNTHINIYIERERVCAFVIIIVVECIQQYRERESVCVCYYNCGRMYTAF